MNLRIHSKGKSDDKLKSEAIHILSVNNQREQAQKLKLVLENCQTRQDIINAIDKFGIYVYDKIG